MEPVYKFPASPGTPLFPVSPERANRIQLQQSPSVPVLSQFTSEHFASAHSRGVSDVQGKVAQFNSLSKEAAQRRKENEAALKRAVLGREEAESETRRLRDENRNLRLEVEEGRARERKVGERLEGVMEELQRSKETQDRSQHIYEKEVRRARKEAFKSSSAVVNLQEELKTARNRYTLMREEADAQRRKADAKEQETFTAQYQLVAFQEEADAQRRKADAKEQETFTAQYQLVAFQEEWEALKQRLTVVEEERNSLKTSLKEEELARIAAEGAIALPPSQEGDEFSSPRKRSRRDARDSLKENIDPEANELEDEFMALKEDLRMEMRKRMKADDQIHFMKMECQFQCCSCRVAERRGVKYVHDNSFAKEVAEMATPMLVEHVVPADETGLEHQIEESLTPDRQSSPEQQSADQLIVFSPTTGTFSKATALSQTAISPQPTIIATARSPTPPAEQSVTTTSPPPQPPFTLFSATPRPLPSPPVTAPRTVGPHNGHDGSSERRLLQRCYEHTRRHQPRRSARADQAEKRAGAELCGCDGDAEETGVGREEGD